MEFIHVLIFQMPELWRCEWSPTPRPPGAIWEDVDALIFDLNCKCGWHAQQTGIRARKHLVEEWASGDSIGSSGEDNVTLPPATTLFPLYFFPAHLITINLCSPSPIGVPERRTKCPNGFRFWSWMITKPCVAAFALCLRAALWEVCGEAVNGRDAVEKARALKPDLIVMDSKHVPYQWSRYVPPDTSVRSAN